MCDTSQLIRYISARSNKYGDLLLEFLDDYGLYCLANATEAQLTEYILNKFGEVIDIERK